MIFVLAVIGIVVAEFWFNKRNVEYIGLLRRLDAYLVDFRHLYYKTASISEGLENAECSGTDKVSRLKQYRLFMVLCEIVRENGDSVTKEGSVFLRNLSTLRHEISETIRNFKERKYAFSGMTLVCCAPLLLTHIIEKWAVSGIPGMESFYNGIGGNLVKMLLLISVVGGYIYIIQKREGFEIFSTGKSNRIAEAEEIKNLRSIILMLKEIKGITVVRLLEIMESFSEIFKQELDKCLNEYSFCGREAIVNLRNRTENVMFKGLAENLFNCDISGIPNAFEEVGIEQESFVEEQKLLMKESLKREATYAYIVSMFPMGIVVVLYLTMPFILEGMAMLEEVINNMKNI